MTGNMCSGGTRLRNSHGQGGASQLEQAVTLARSPARGGWRPAVPPS